MSNNCLGGSEQDAPATDPAVVDTFRQIFQTFANEHREFFEELVAVGIEENDIHKLDIWGLQRYEGFSSRCDVFLYNLRNELIRVFPELENRVTKVTERHVPREVFLEKLRERLGKKIKNMEHVFPQSEL